MTRDREVNLGDLDEVAVDDKPLKRPASQAPSTARPAGGGKATGKMPAAITPRGGSGGGWIVATLLLAALVVAMGIWFNQQMGEMRAQLDNRMSESSQKLGNLASQLSATDENLNQSSDKLLDTVKQHGSALDKNRDEIRKLWDVSNKRNKDLIEENSKKLGSMTSSLAAVKKSQASVDSRVKGIDEQVAGLKTQVQSAVDAINKSSSQWQSQISQMQTQIDVLAENVKQLERQNQSVKNSVAKLESAQKNYASLGSRVDDVEAAVAAFDAYRLQVNNRLDKLEQR